MADTDEPDPPVLAWLTVRQASFGKPSSILEVYLLRASAVERDALIAEIKSHDYWASAEVLAEEYRTLPEVTPHEVRRQLYWLFED